jgi:serine/threonine-protein kinase RsbW
MGHPIGRLRLVTESLLENTAMLGSAIRGLALAASLDETAAFQLELCVIEATTNAIRHAYSGMPGNEVEVIVELVADRISFSVCDSGKTHPDFEQMTPLSFDWESLDQVSEGGMGLSIIRKIMDEVQYRSGQGRNCLVMTKFLVAENPPATS